MEFKQYDNGSCDIIFSKEEIQILSTKGKLHFSDKMLKHFGNCLVSMVMNWQEKFKENIAKEITYDTTKIEGK